MVSSVQVGESEWIGVKFTMSFIGDSFPRILAGATLPKLKLFEE